MVLCVSYPCHNDISAIIWNKSSQTKLIVFVVCTATPVMQRSKRCFSTVVASSNGNKEYNIFVYRLLLCMYVLHLVHISATVNQFCIVPSEESHIDSTSNSMSFHLYSSPSSFANWEISSFPRSVGATLSYPNLKSPLDLLMGTSFLTSIRFHRFWLAATL